MRCRKKVGVQNGVCVCVIFVEFRTVCAERRCDFCAVFWGAFQHGDAISLPVYVFHRLRPEHSLNYRGQPCLARAIGVALAEVHLPFVRLHIGRV